MRVGFAFFKARYGGLLSNAIALRTGGPYSHVEFYLPDCYVTEEGTEIKRHLCFSSYERDEGVRWKHIQIECPRWGRLEFEVTDELVSPALAWSNRQVGKKYDWAGIMGFVNPRRKGGDPDRWFCSEICHAIALRLKLMMLGAHRSDSVSPQKLWHLLSKMDSNIGQLPATRAVDPLP